MAGRVSKNLLQKKNKISYLLISVETNLKVTFFLKKTKTTTWAAARVNIAQKKKDYSKQQSIRE